MYFFPTLKYIVLRYHKSRNFFAVVKIPSPITRLIKKPL